MVMGHLFGTDGIRGKFNEYPMTTDLALEVGKAIALIFKHQTDTKKQIVIGKDTRGSGDILENAIVSGICSAGVDALQAEILPTPGIAFLTRSLNAMAGVVISASHNPYDDNGIKLFNNKGFKLSKSFESRIEKEVLDKNKDEMPDVIYAPGHHTLIKNAREQYVDFLYRSIVSPHLIKDIKIVIDCSNGATYKVVPELFHRLGATTEFLSVNPNGKNINDGCGSEHPEILAKTVIQKGADIGLAFDGDGDRLIAIDEKGLMIDGDQVIAILADAYQKKNQLKNNLVVTTIMSNIGLRFAMQKMGIQHIMTDVGDRMVMQELVKRKAVLGGENSGHIILLNHHTTGDGIISALKLIEILSSGTKSLSELKKIITIFPQILINVEVREKPDLRTIKDIQRLIKSVESRLSNQGRVLVRYSGTQPQCRVMVEGPTHDIVNEYGQEIADAVKNHIGK